MLASAVCRSPALMARLNTATAAIREEHDILSGRVSWLDYRLFLVRLYGFHATIEAGLGAFRPLASVVPDAALRNHKAALIAHDLVALGLERRELVQLPRMTLGAPLTLPDALGWTYVVESATVSGKLLARRLARQLPEEIQRASAYLGCYGDEAPTRWRELGEALDGFALGRPVASAPSRRRARQAWSEHAAVAVTDDSSDTDRACDRVIDAAREGLIRLHRWLGPAVQPRPTQRHA